MEAAPKNYRDVAVALQQLVPNHTFLPPKRLLRAGQVDFLSWESIGSPGTVINLRMIADDPTHAQNVKYLHFPIPNSVEKYNTRLGDVRTWLTEILRAFESASLKYPVLVHCYSGKDRTGVVIAVLLTILGVPREVIISEFLQCPDVSRSDIELSLAEIEKKGAGYFKGVDLAKIKRNILGK